MSDTAESLRDMVRKISMGSPVGFEYKASTINRAANEITRLEGENKKLLSVVVDQDLREAKQKTENAALQAQLDEANDKVRWRDYSELPEAGSQIIVKTPNHLYLSQKSGELLEDEKWLPIPDTDKPELARVEAEGVGDNNGFFEITQDQG